MLRKKIELDVTTLAKKMIELGFNGENFDNWTNTFLDVLEQTYYLETILNNEILKLKGKTDSLAINYRGR